MGISLHKYKKQFCKNIDSSSRTKGGQLCPGLMRHSWPCTGRGAVDLDFSCLKFNCNRFNIGYLMWFLICIDHFYNFYRRRNHLHLYKQLEPTCYIPNTARLSVFTTTRMKRFATHNYTRPCILHRYSVITGLNQQFGLLLIPLACSVFFQVRTLTRVPMSLNPEIQFDHNLV